MVKNMLARDTCHHCGHADEHNVQIGILKQLVSDMVSAQPIPQPPPLAHPAPRPGREGFAIGGGCAKTLRKLNERGQDHKACSLLDSWYRRTADSRTKDKTRMVSEGAGHCPHRKVLICEIEDP